MLLTSHLTHPGIEQLFSDAATIARWVEVEATLAQVQGELGVIGVDSAENITTALPTFQPNLTNLQAAMQHSGVPIAALVKQLRLHVGAPHGDFIHYGATTQDIMDTALILQLRDAITKTVQPILDLSIQNLATLANQHRKTLIAGRTHSQHALPITFGLKVTNWLAPLLRQRKRLAELLPRMMMVQFAGAAGTLSTLGDNGLLVQSALAQRLNLGVPTATWHTQRDTLLEFTNWLSLLSGMLAKIAKDVILLAQSELGELHESSDPTRGGSSTMPQKRNPMISEALVTIHRLNTGDLATLHSTMAHEHERATDSWQTEWRCIPAMLSRTAAALEKANWLAQNIVVNESAMMQTVLNSNGLMLAEAASFALAKFMPRAQAKNAVRDAIQTVLAKNIHLIDLLQAQHDLPIDWAALREESNYLGTTDQLIDRVLAATQSQENKHD